MGVPNIKIYYDKDIGTKTLEPQIVKCNKLETMNLILGCNKETQDDLIEYMSTNKTECSLRIFDSPTDIVIPDYIRDAIDGK